MLGAHDTITVWNRFRDGKLDTWYRRVLTGCSWQDEIKSASTGSGVTVGGLYTVLIPVHRNYVSPDVWKTLDSVDRDKYWTLGIQELVAKGDIDVRIGLESPYTESLVKAALKPHSFSISVISDAAAEHKRGRHYMIAGV